MRDPWADLSEMEMGLASALAPDEFMGVEAGVNPILSDDLLDLTQGALRFLSSHGLGDLSPIKLFFL